MNIITKTAALLAISVTLAGCAYQVHTMSAPDLDVYADYTAKVPGRWAIFVGGHDLHKTLHPDGYTCSADSFPIDLRSSFSESVLATFGNLVESSTHVSQPLTLSALKARGFTGQIEITPDGLRNHLDMIPGFFTSKADARIELDAGLVATDTNGRLIGTHASGNGEATAGAGAFCDGAAKALATASQRAMSSLLGELGERFTNSRRVRAAAKIGSNVATK